MQINQKILDHFPLILISSTFYNVTFFCYKVIGELVQGKKLCQESYLNVEIDGVCKVSFTLTNHGTLLLDAKTTNSAPICMNGI